MGEKQPRASHDMSLTAYAGLLVATGIAAAVTGFQAYQVANEEVHVAQSPVVTEHTGSLGNSQQSKLDKWVEDETNSRNSDAIKMIAAGGLTTLFGAGVIPEFRRRRTIGQAKAAQKQSVRV